jgi:pimeloyl-ACP methyl ester carboxylesterase
MAKPEAPEAPTATVARLDAAASHRTTPFAGGAMHWRSWGQGAPLLLLHGASGSWTHWIRNIPALAAHYRVLAPDLPGFGDADDAPEPHTAEALADALLAGLDALAPPDAPLRIAGFSFGGIVGGLAAARLGRRVRRLVLLGTGGMALPYEPTRPLLRLPPAATPAEAARVHRENLHILMIADAARIDDLAVHVQAENLRRARFRSGAIPTSDVLLRVLPAIRARLGGIWGSRDAFAAPFIEERRRTLAAVQPGVDFRVIEGAGHWAIYEAAAQVNAALLELLGEG